MTDKISLPANSIHIWRIDLDGPTRDISSLLSIDETIRAEGIRQVQAKERFIRGRGAMRAILGDYLSIPGNELEFTQGEKGKPYLGHPNSIIEFNLTHCEGMALLALARQFPLGIDLELVRTRTSQLKIAQRMFPEQIFSELAKLPSDQLATSFFRHWTELEARTKCEGDGIFSHEGGRSDITSRHFYPQDGWIACVAAKGVDISHKELKHFVYMN